MFLLSNLKISRLLEIFRKVKGYCRFFLIPEVNRLSLSNRSRDESNQFVGSIETDREERKLSCFEVQIREFNVLGLLPPFCDPHLRVFFFLRRYLNPGSHGVVSVDCKCSGLDSNLVICLFRLADESSEFRMWIRRF